MLLSISLFTLLRCGIAPLAGGTTDTGNQMIVATMYDEAGGRVIGASVFVRPASYLKPFMLPKTAAERMAMVTDTSGGFAIDSLAPGEYCIEVNDRSASRAVMIRVTIPRGFSGSMNLKDTLRPYAGIEGSIDREPPVFTYAQVYGIDRCVVVDASGKFAMSDLPPGTYTLHIASTDPAFKPVEIGNAACPAGIVTRLPLAAWTRSRRIVLNTSAAGANVGATVTGFPVLIRLNAGNFDFSQAMAGGADIRFVKKDMAPLAYEIERWDAIAREAELWVRVDTLWGDSGAQYLLMYWGNPDALSLSGGGNVFDTADAFRGVWHCGEKSGTVDDATYYRHHGSRIGNQQQTAGAIGFGQAYTDSGDYSDMGDVCNPGASHFTLSAWIKRSDTGGVYTIIGKTNGDTILQPNYGWLLALNKDYLRLYVASGGTRWGDVGTFFCESSVKIADRNNWHFICAVVDKSRNAGCKVFVDGVDVTKLRSGDITRVGALSNALPMRIGIEADNDFPLKGSVDEAVVSYAAHSADWIKLCYMNQKPDNQLVEFK
jgi:hypothetical protein